MTSLLICRTCPRYERAPGPGDTTRGRKLADRLRAAAADRDDLDIRVVNCLAGCKAPCNVSITAPSKWRLRLSGLGPQSVDDLLLTVERYAASADGNLDDDDLPASLRGLVSARSPARIGD